VRVVATAVAALCICACGDPPICPSDVFVAIQTSQVTVDTDAVAAGIQTDVRVRTSLLEGEEVTLEVFEPVSTLTATTDANGIAIFTGVTVDGPESRIRASISVLCGDASDELVIPVAVANSCTLVLSPAPDDNFFYAPARVYNTLSDPDPNTPGYQATAIVNTSPGTTVEIFENTGSGEVSLGTFDVGASGIVEVPRTLFDGPHSYRAFCTRDQTAAISDVQSIVVDVTPPSCAFVEPPPGTTITPSFDNNLDLSDGIQLLVTAQVTGDDVQDEPTTLTIAPLGGTAQAVSSTKIDSSGRAGGFTTLAPASSPATFIFEFTARDHALNECTTTETYDVVLDACDLVVTSPTTPVTVDADASAAGSQVDIALQVSAACEGRTVTSTCGLDDPSGVVTGGVVTLRAAFCATSPCELTEACTFSVSTADGVTTQTSATIAFDDLGPATTVAIVTPALACGTAITPASDADPATDGVQVIARVTSPGSDTRSLRVTNEGGTATLDAATDVTLTLAPGLNQLVGIGADSLGNLGASPTCSITLADISVSFSPPAADGTLGRPDGAVAGTNLTFPLCGTVSRTGATVDVAVDGGTSLAATVTGTTWCRTLTLAQGSHTIVATATAGASTGASTLVLRVDLTAPPPVDSFVAVALDRRTLQMSFEAPAEQVVSYLAKVSTTPITEANFDTTGTLLTSPAPGSPGADQQIEFTPALLQLSYHLAIATVDEAGNRSVASIAGPLSPFLDRSGAILAPDALGSLRFGSAIAHGRFNDDDIDDLAISAPTQNAGGSASAGAVYLYFGSALGISATPDAVITSSVANARFGAGLTAVRWSSTTRDDLVVGAPGLDRISIFRNLAAGARDAVTADATITFTASSLGAALATADVDGEGTPDLVASVPTHSANNGGAIILYGDTFPATGNVDLDTPGANGAIAELFTDPTNSSRQLGTYLHNVGPTLGTLDATDDLVLAYLDDTSTLDRLFVLRSDGSRPAAPGLTPRTFTPGRDLRLDYVTNSALTEFGAHATTIDDRDNDGSRELVVTAHAFNNNRGQVLVIAGDTLGSSGVALTTEPGVVLTTINGASQQRLGAILLARSTLDSDFDGAGADDLLLVAREGNGSLGFLWYGTALPAGATTTATASFSFSTPSSFRIGQVNRTGALGVARWVGDLDDDGLEDVCWASRIDAGDDGSFEVFD
jgi:hypothetical protein